MNANEMIERYAHEVGRNLPRKGRADIEQELKSLLQDTVEERAGGAEPTEQTVVKVLLDFGSPEQMASEYRPTQYVIGPRIYPIFRFVANIVLGALAVAYVVLIMVTLWAGDRSNPAETIWNMTLSFGQSAIVSLGIVTLIFAAIEHFWSDQIDSELDSAEWDPYKLPPVDDPNRINRGEKIAGVIATVIFTGIFLMLIRPEGALAWLFTDEFRVLIPLIIASTAVEVILNVVVIWQGRWTRLTRTLEIGSELFGWYVLYRVVTGGAVTTIEFVNWILSFALVIALVVDGIGILVKLFKLISGRSVPTSWKPSTLKSS